VISQIRTSLDDTYFPKRPHLIAMAQYITEMLVVSQGRTDG
jgi:hypothetical protein